MCETNLKVRKQMNMNLKNVRLNIKTSESFNFSNLITTVNKILDRYLSLNNN